MTIEKSLRHATVSRYQITPTPTYRWIADNQYISSSGSPPRAQTWSASNGGYHLSKEGQNGPKVDEITNQGVFFEGGLADTSLRTYMSSSSPIDAGISHSFVVMKMISASGVSSVLVGFSNANNHYLVLDTGATWATTSFSASVATFSHTSNLGNTPGWKGDRNKNIMNFKFRGTTTAERTYFGFNSASIIMMNQNVAGFGAFKTGNSKIRFGRRSNAIPDEGPYSGSIYDVLLYSNSLTNDETGSIINQLMRIWGIT